MVDVEKVLDDAGVTNPRVREYVAYWAELTGAARVEVVTAADDDRLIQEALDAGELLPAGEGRYYSRSYHKDTARSEERTIVATSNPEDKGVYNNWRPASEMKPLLHDRMRGASAGKTMYVIPYLMSPPGNALAEWAAARLGGRPTLDATLAIPKGKLVVRRLESGRIASIGLQLDELLQVEPDEKLLERLEAEADELSGLRRWLSRLPRAARKRGSDPPPA